MPSYQVVYIDTTNKACAQEHDTKLKDALTRLDAVWNTVPVKGVFIRQWRKARYAVGNTYCVLHKHTRGDCR